MHTDDFIAEALRLEGITGRLAHEAAHERGLRAALGFVRDLAPRIPYPGPCHLRTLAYVLSPMTAMRWRVYDLDGYPPAAKVPALMQLWCNRLTTWSPEYAYQAMLKVQPFGDQTRLLALLVYQWLKHTWNHPVLPPAGTS